MKPSITSVISALFLLFISHSVWNLLSIFQVPSCDQSDICYKSYLNSNPNLDLFLFISDNSRSGIYTQVLHVEKFNYHDKFEKKISISLSDSVRKNGSITIHSVLVPSKNKFRNKNLNSLLSLPDSTYVKSKLTKYAVPVSSTFNLLSEENVIKKSLKPVTHIRSKFALVMCPIELNIPQNNIPIELIKQMRLKSNNQFLPILQRDIMQMRLQDLVEVNHEMDKLNISFLYTPVSYGKLRFILQIDSSLNQFLNLGFSEKDLDEVKNIFADTNLYLLCITVFIGGVHLLFDFLSFRNEVSFWKNQSSMAGLSSRTVLWRAFSQTIIFLYLLNEKTSLLVLVPSGIATVIEFWKVSKALKTTISWRYGFKFDRNYVETSEEKKTREYDEECMKYLSYLLYPLCIGAAVYSLIYQPHKSWYSWTLNSLVNGVYAFGFLFMLPQLFINYRLKSVAALPWRAFTYRAFNTFIDDIFAFIITMPTAHRLACFRDDVVFLIYLYQRWLYPVDKSRKDDMALGEAEDDDSKKKTQ
ncbi:cleft lip and palate transmembrane protein 1-like protein isoform X2 [Coccinella septempunctata]|uniref:cleft lip and palate transmembrane protein 1-like protein isoform X1 n=1 Tax=Coccinella septempunctata TaxID=41139 RepID=UPI001D0610F2|nr:cleft lip and palate transmembrane protein 1-like protein isoform X1 [Coccinella septempunctata]XP_044752291.1 cleft lip and palate transmembrane protein 1-like protein isoform X2 [Coccinella septempunctata]